MVIHGTLTCKSGSRYFYYVDLTYLVVIHGTLTCKSGSRYFNYVDLTYQSVNLELGIFIM